MSALRPVRFSVLRGVCQTPAYVAHAQGLFREEGLEAKLTVVPTAWMVPERLSAGDTDFGVIPWTRVAAVEPGDAALKVVCGSGIEEAAIVVRKGIASTAVRSIAVPREGGMKDLTAMGLIESLGWKNAKQVRCPSGDGAILALVGQGADAASMVEPYATMLERLGIGTVLRRTGDVWRGAPGCSLSTSAALIDQDPDFVQGVVHAYVKAIGIVRRDPALAAAAAAPYIGVDAGHIEAALRANRPDADAVRNRAAMDGIVALMRKLGYVDHEPRDYVDLRFLDHASRDPRVAAIKA